AHDLKDFLARNHAPYTFYDVERDEDGLKVAAKVDKDKLPLVVLTSGEKLFAPTVSAVAQKLGLRSTAKQQTYDFAIVGGGPAGGGLRRLGRLEHDPDRKGSARRPGRHVEQDRELPRLPPRPLRRRSGPPRGRASQALRRRDHLAAGHLSPALRRAVQAAE